MKIPFLSLKSQYESIKKELDQAYYEVMSSGNFIQGQKVEEFERELARYYRVNHVVAVGNGTQALEITLKTFDLPKNSEVLLPAYGWISTAHAIVLAGMKPVFIDLAPGSFHFDHDKVEEKISDKTRVIIPVHLFGEIKHSERLYELAKRHDLLVLEDAAQAHGLNQGLVGVGQMSKAAILSFYPTKQLGAYGDAGAVLTNDIELADKVRKWANYGADFPERNYVLPGTNSRLDELQASFLVVKLKYLDGWIKRRREIASTFNKELGSIGEIELPAITTSHSFYQYAIRLEKRDGLKSFFDERGIGFGTNYEYVIPYTDFYNQTSGFSQAEKAANSVINLPCYPELTDQQILYVCNAIKSYFSR